MGVQGLCQDIRNLINGKKSQQGTAQAYISGSKALVNGTWYTWASAVDVDIEDGDIVWVVIDNTHTRAVVVGK